MWVSALQGDVNVENLHDICSQSFADKDTYYDQALSAGE